MIQFESFFPAVKDSYPVMALKLSVDRRIHKLVERPVSERGQIDDIDIITEEILEQIEKQLAKLEDVLDIKKLEPGLSVCRELIMIKIRALDTQRQAVMNVTEIFHGKIVDVTHDSMIIELIGTQDKLDNFIDLLSGYEILELARTGITGLTRGSNDVVMLD